MFYLINFITHLMTGKKETVVGLIYSNSLTQGTTKAGLCEC